MEKHFSYMSEIINQKAYYTHKPLNNVTARFAPPVACIFTFHITIKYYYYIFYHHSDNNNITDMWWKLDPLNWCICVTSSISLQNLHIKAPDCVQRAQTSANQNWSGIQIDISGLIQIWTSAGLLPKCCGFIIWSPSVISLGVSVTVWENGNKFIKPAFCNGEGSGKVIRTRHPGPDHQQKLTSSSSW